MIEIQDKKDCCGCHACVAVCAKHCITMQTDEEGFLYPHINETKCVKCYRCLGVCAFKKDQQIKGYIKR